LKANIHPRWFDDAIVTCSCGNTFVTGSTKSAIKVEICGSCHPFFTGEQRIVDTEGRVARLKRKYNL
jgi:large subunit ribosomal protein L31